MGKRLIINPSVMQQQLDLQTPPNAPHTPEDLEKTLKDYQLTSKE